MTDREATTALRSIERDASDIAGAAAVMEQEILEKNERITYLEGKVEKLESDLADANIQMEELIEQHNQAGEGRKG